MGDARPMKVGLVGFDALMMEKGVRNLTRARLHTRMNIYAPICNCRSVQRQRIRFSSISKLYWPRRRTLFLRQWQRDRTYRNLGVLALQETGSHGTDGRPVQYYVPVDLVCIHY